MKFLDTLKDRLLPKKKEEVPHKENLVSEKGPSFFGEGEPLNPLFQRIDPKYLPEAKKIFEISHLSLFYNHGKKQGLKDVSLDVYEKRVLALIGPSGCGKSTLLRSLNRMNDLIEGTSISGEIRYNGVSVNELDTIYLRTKVGMVFQQPNPFPMSIRDNLYYGPRCQGLRDKAELERKAVESLKKAALYEEVRGNLDGSALALSGGQQQRLCIARALMMSPEVLLMDEPTSALDPIATLKIEDLIRELRKEYTIVIVTHNMQQAARISDYTAFFMLGELVECNKTEVFYSEPRDKRSEDYITGRFG